MSLRIGVASAAEAGRVAPAHSSLGGSGDLRVGDLLLVSKLVGAELVEMISTAPGSADITALGADRIVREILNGIVLRRRPGG